MCEVEKDFCEDGEMPMIVREIKVSVFAASCMRGNEDVMEALGNVNLLYSIPAGWRVVGKIFKT